MIFTETKLKNAFIIQPERLGDQRGFFARTWCQREFEARGLNPCLVQCNISFNKKKGTLRGMHYQTAPYEEAKLIRCTKERFMTSSLIYVRTPEPSPSAWPSS
jgi:dTDP-4-dehydrorhamnose 3,5-epimerase